MKLSKKMVVMGILFSSVLGSLNVGNVIAQAADTSQESTANVGNEKGIDVIYKYGDKVLDKKAVKSTINADGTLSESKIEPLNSNRQYRIKPDQSFMVSRDSVSGIRYVNVQLEKIRTISVKLFLDGQPMKIYDIDVLDTDTTVSVSQLGLDLNSTRVVDGQTTFNIDNDHIVRVDLESTKIVDVIYNDENGLESRIPFGEVTVFAGKNELTSDEVPTPEGYTIIPGQRFRISKNGATSVIRVKVKSNENLESLKPTDPKPNVKPGASVKPTNPSNPSKNGSYAVQKVRITFVDKNTNELVGNLQLNGLATHAKKIEAPKNYELVNAKDADIKFDTKGNKDLKISVRKTKSAITKSEGIVTTNNGEYKRLYTIDGKMVGNRALAAGTKWYTDQQITVGGDLMYRVATNEWVKASDVQ